MTVYRSLPAGVEAMQFRAPSEWLNRAEDTIAFDDWLVGQVRAAKKRTGVKITGRYVGSCLVLKYGWREFHAISGDYIVFSAGDVFAVPKDVFEATYEKVP